MFFPAISPHDSISAGIPYLPPHGGAAYLANCSLLRVGGAILSILERFKKKENKICIRLSLRQQIYVPKVCSNTALNVKIIVNQNTKRNLFQRFKNSGIQVFGYSGIQVIRYSGIQIFRYSGIQVFGYSGIQVFRYSGIQVFGYSCIQVFRHSGIQVFKYSGIQVFRYPGIEAMSLSYSQCTQSDCFTIFICSRTSVGASVAE